MFYLHWLSKSSFICSFCGNAFASSKRIVSGIVIFLTLTTPGNFSIGRIFESASGVLSDDRCADTVAHA